MQRLSLNLFPEFMKTSLNSYAFPISLVAIWHFPTSAIVTIPLSLSLFVFFNHFQQHIHLLSNPSASLIRLYLKHHRRSFMLKRAFLMQIFIYYFPNPIRYSVRLKKRERELERSDRRLFKFFRWGNKS